MITYLYCSWQNRERIDICNWESLQIKWRRGKGRGEGRSGEGERGGVRKGRRKGVRGRRRIVCSELNSNHSPALKPSVVQVHKHSTENQNANNHHFLKLPLCFTEARLRLATYTQSKNSPFLLPLSRAPSACTCRLTKA